MAAAVSAEGYVFIGVKVKAGPTAGVLRDVISRNKEQGRIEKERKERKEIERLEKSIEAMKREDEEEKERRIENSPMKDLLLRRRRQREEAEKREEEEQSLEEQQRSYGFSLREKSPQTSRFSAGDSYKPERAYNDGTRGHSTDADRYSRELNSGYYRKEDDW